MHARIASAFGLFLGWALVAGIVAAIIGSGANIAHLGWPTFLFFAATGLPVFYLWAVVFSPILYRITKGKQ